MLYFILYTLYYIIGFPQWLAGKESTCNAGDTGDKGLIPGSGRSPGGGNGNLFQYSCQENLKDRGIWWVTVHRVSKNKTLWSEWAQLRILYYTTLYYTLQFSSVQWLSHVWLFVTPMDCSTPGLVIHHQLPESTQTHVHWVGDTIQPTHPLSSPSPPTFNLSQCQGSKESAPQIRCPKYWSFSFNILVVLPTNTQDWSPLEWTGLDHLAVQGTLKSLLQHHSSKTSILWHSALFTVQLSHPSMTTVKTVALARWTFVGKVMSLLFNMLSRLVITLLPTSKRLLISWLQSPSAVILEPPKIKSATVSPPICLEVMGPEAMILASECWAFILCCTIMLLLVNHSVVSDCPGSSVHGILQAGVLEWAAMPSSRRAIQLRNTTRVSCIAGRFFTTELPGKLVLTI